MPLAAGGQKERREFILTPSQLFVCSAGVQGTLAAYLFAEAYVEVELLMSYSDSVALEIILQMF